MPARQKQEEESLGYYLLTFLAGLDASRDCEPEPADGEDYLVPQVHELVLHLDGPLPALPPPVSAGDSHRYRP